MEILNINVGILGHVDSGKTSLVKALSTVLSTASLDKNPQSRERGITLDLGFSSFSVPLPKHLPQGTYSNLQFTLVDCPGHASLIRTIIGGAQIMDVMLLVVDTTKGMQAQTMECVVIGDAVMTAGASVIVVLNKVDLIPEEERKERIRQAKEDISAHLKGTKLSHASFVPCAAAVGREETVTSSPGIASPSKGKNKKRENPPENKGGGGGATTDIAKSSTKASTEEGPDNNAGSRCVSAREVTDRASAPGTCQEKSATMGIDAVVEELTRLAAVPERRASAPLYFAFDHCFSVRGKGTILTGTVLTGVLTVNEVVELPALRLQKKVKSMQMFRKPVSVARAGDRVGVCVSSLDAKLLERGILTTPGSLRPLTTAVALVRKVPAFNGQCRSGSYCHVSLGHTTAMATATFFGASELKSRHTSSFGGTGGEGKETKATAHGSEDGLSLDEVACLRFPWEAEFVQQAKLVGRVHVASDDPFATADVEECAQHDGQNDEGDALQYCHLSFHTPVIAPENSVVVGSRLDTSGLALTNTSATGRLPGSGTGDSQCRIAFHGRLVAPAAGNSKTPGDAGAGIEFGTEAGQVKLFTEKLKTGVVARMGADTNAAVQTGDMIDVYGKDLFKKETNMSPFAGMILLSEGNSVGHIVSAFGKAGRFKARFPAGSTVKVGDKLVLKFRKYLRDQSKRMDQDYLRKAMRRRQQQQTAEGQAARCKQPAQAEQPSAPSIRVDAMPVENEPPLRTGVVESIKDAKDGSAGSIIAIVSGLFSQAEDIRALAKVGIAVRTTSSTDPLVGDVRGPFGKVGKCKVEFRRGGTVQVGDQVFVPR